MRKFIKPIAIASVAATASFSAHAAEETFQASVQVLAPITITEDGAMSFGRITAPNNGNSNTFTATGSAPTGTGNGSYLSGATPALFQINGSDGEQVAYSFAAGTCNDGGLMALTITTPGATTLLPIVDLIVDAALDVQSGVSAGNYQCDYTVTANYQ